MPRDPHSKGQGGACEPAFLRSFGSAHISKPLRKLVLPTTIKMGLAAEPFPNCSLQMRPQTLCSLVRDPNTEDS